MIILAITLSWLAAICFYLASPHQYFWIAIKAQARMSNILTIAAALTTGLAIFCAWISLGFWAGFFTVLTALMLGLVALPYIDAYRRTRNVG